MKWPAGMPASTQVGLQHHAENGVRLSIGDYSYGTPALLYNSGDPHAKLTIGKFCCFADEVQIFLGCHGRHHYDFLSSYPMGMLFGVPARPYSSSAIRGDLSVSIGSDVWIGRRSTIMAGVRIGHGSVVGACSLVIKEVDPYSIIAGVPAKPIRTRFTQRQIERLLAAEWWNLPEDVLRRHIDQFYTADIEAALATLEAERRKL